MVRNSPEGKNLSYTKFLVRTFVFPSYSASRWTVSQKSPRQPAFTEPRSGEAVAWVTGCFLCSCGRKLHTSPRVSNPPPTTGCSWSHHPTYQQQPPRVGNQKGPLALPPESCHSKRSTVRTRVLQNTICSQIRATNCHRNHLVTIKGISIVNSQANQA